MVCITIEWCFGQRAQGPSSRFIFLKVNLFTTKGNYRDVKKNMLWKVNGEF